MQFRNADGKNGNIAYVMPCTLKTCGTSTTHAPTFTTHVHKHKLTNITRLHRQQNFKKSHSNVSHAEFTTWS